MKTADLYRGRILEHNGGPSVSQLQGRYAYNGLLGVVLELVYFVGCPKVAPVMGLGEQRSNLASLPLRNDWPQHGETPWGCFRAVSRSHNQASPALLYCGCDSRLQSWFPAWQTTPRLSIFEAGSGDGKDGALLLVTADDIYEALGEFA
jgi:hypothetical protein